MKFLLLAMLLAHASPPHPHPPHPPGPGPGPHPDGDPPVVSCFSIEMIMGGSVTVTRASGGRFRVRAERFQGHSTVDSLASGTIKPPQGGRLDFDGGYFRCKQVPAAETVIGQIKFQNEPAIDMSCSYEHAPIPFE